MSSAQACLHANIAAMHMMSRPAVQQAHILDLNGKLVIVCVLSQADLPSTPDVLEIALEDFVYLLHCALEVRIPLILCR